MKRGKGRPKVTTAERQQKAATARRAVEEEPSASRKRAAKRLGISMRTLMNRLADDAVDPNNKVASGTALDALISLGQSLGPAPGGGSPEYDDALSRLVEQHIAAMTHILEVLGNYGTKRRSEPRQPVSQRA
jgi:hypothetical protein